MLFSISMFPVGQGDSLAHPVAEVIDEIDRAGLSYQVTAMDTQVEGEWDDVIPVIRAAQKKLLKEHARVYLTLSVDEHRGAPTNRLDEAVDDVDDELGRKVPR